MGDGAIAMRGEVLKWRGPRRYDLNITAEKVPVQSLLSVIRLPRRICPMTCWPAEGGGPVPPARDRTSPLELEGGGQTTGFRLQSRHKIGTALDTLPFSLLTRAPEKPPKKLAPGAMPLR